MNKQVAIFCTGLIFMGFILTGCGEDHFVPRPPTYLRPNLPKANYVEFSDQCPYRFEISSLYTVSKVENTCHKDIDLGLLNGVIHFSYIAMEKPLADYINYAIDKVDEHKIKATGIEDERVIRQKDRVFGTVFHLKGDVASPIQFYLTDSLTHFVSGVVYFNAPPNSDSLRPSVAYLQKDIDRMIQSFQWK